MPEPNPSFRWIFYPSFRRKPESSVVIPHYGDVTGDHRFRLAPE